MDHILEKHLFLVYSSFSLILKFFVRFIYLIFPPLIKGTRPPFPIRVGGVWGILYFTTVRTIHP
jgi:hypothetical protein